MSHGHIVRAEWIAADWGTSHLRVWAMDAQERSVASDASDRGMAELGPDEFEPALLELISPWLRPEKRTTVVACGMVGARQGWVETPYLQVPTPPPASPDATRAPTLDGRIDVRLMPGLRQNAPADVMRGEETQIAGHLRREPDFEGVLCLPGTHSKWAHVSAGEIVSFSTCLTGELFALLAEQSVLRHGIASSGWSQPDFCEAVEDSIARPERLAMRLFSLRAEALLEDLDGSRARARLSGYLIGAELAATRPYWLGRDVVLIATPALTGPYREALSLCGVEAREMSGEDAVLAGLSAAHAQLEVLGG